MVFYGILFCNYLTRILPSRYLLTLSCKVTVVALQTCFPAYHTNRTFFCLKFFKELKCKRCYNTINYFNFSTNNIFAECYCSLYYTKIKHIFTIKLYFNLNCSILLKIVTHQYMTIMTDYENYALNCTILCFS